MFLFPGFDEFLLGYADRRATLPSEYAERIVPDGNGVFQPTVIDDGRVVGTWKRSGRGARRRIIVTPFTSFRPQVSDALPELCGSRISSGRVAWESRRGGTIARLRSASIRMGVSAV